MKEQWQQLNDKLSALEQRQKIMVLAAGLFLLLYVGGMFFVSPLMEQEAKLTKQNNNLNGQSKQVMTQIEQTTLALQRDYTKLIKDEIQALKQKINHTNEQLSKFSQGFVLPEKMPMVLKGLLNTQRKLTLSQFDLLGVQPVKIGEAPNQKVVFYEHSMQLAIQGEYFALLAYIESLQRIEEKLFIQSFDYKVQEYPKAELTLVVSTVSADEVFISL